jgi:hypothetical protein
VADYRLRAVRDVRARTERARVGELASAVGDARATQARLDGAKERSKAARDAVAAALVARDTLLSSGATSTQLAQAERFVARRRKALADALAEEVRCEVAHLEREGDADAARLTLRRARAEREVIERHFERWRTEQKKLADRRE